MAVSSVTAERNTRQNAAARPGATSGRVTRQNTSIGLPAQRARDVFEPDRRAGHRRLHRDEREREEEDRVREHEELRASGTGTSAQRDAKNTSASAITRPGSACTM